MTFLPRSPKTPKEFESYFNLRYEVLRKPWGQALGSERDQLEDSAFHAMIWDENLGAVAVCRLQKNNDETGQIRYMAVHPDFRGKGLGKIILEYTEKVGLEMGLKKINLQAREKAVAFYNSNGYMLVKKSHLLYGEVQHYEMSKNLI